MLTLGFKMRNLLRRRASSDDSGTGHSVDVARLEDRVFYSATPFVAEPIDDLPQEYEGDAWLESLGDGGWDIDPDPIAPLDDGKSNRELVVIDGAVDDIQLLLDDLILNADPEVELELLLLDETRDAIDQISEALEGIADLDAMHLVAHGRESQLQLGNHSLDANSILALTDELALWSEAFALDADLLIYGCDIAATSDGEAFLHQLSELLQVDVAASDDATGAADLGGDWDLEVTTGDVDTSILFSPEAQQSWHALLATPVGEADTYRVDEEGTLVTTDADNWFDSDWQARQQLTFNNSAQATSLTDFPVLVVLDGTRIDYSKVQDNGEDLRFVDADGTLLAHEIETWDEGGESFVWVKVSQIDGGSSSDFIHMYYDNATATDGQNADAVWSSGFSGVYHMDGNALDSSLYENDGVITDVVVAGGQIAGGGGFNGSTAIMGVADDPSLDDLFAGGGTITAWINPAGWGETGFGRIVDKASSAAGEPNGWSFRVDATTGSLSFKYGFNSGSGRWRTTFSSIDLDEWQHVAVVYNADDPSNDATLFINGVEATTFELSSPGAVATSDAGLDLGIGNYVNAGFGTRAFDGVIDEVRLVDGERSADWLAAEYLNGSDSFVGFTVEEIGPGGVLTNDTDADGDPLTAILDSGPANAASFNLNPDGSFSYTPLDDFDGTDSFTYFANDGSTNSALTTVTINVTPAQDSPTADAGSNATITEGDSLTLDASASTDPDSGDVLTYAWDLDGDGTYGDVAALLGSSIGDTTSLSWSQLATLSIDDDGTYTIGLEVSDGTATSQDTMTLTVTNLAPVITISGDTTVDEDTAYTLNLNIVDPGDDQVLEWTINWGDGTISTIAGNPTTATHVYEDPNLTYNITASVIQQDDGVYHQGEMLIAAEGSDNITRFDAEGNLIAPPFGDGGELVNHGFMVIGPDGMLYVGGDSDNIVRYNPHTGAMDIEFIPSGTIDRAEGLAFGSDGNLYVASANTNEILRFTPTGQFIDAFVRPAYGLNQPQGIVFGEDGNLYVADANNDRIMRFDGNTGAPMGAFVTSGDGGLDFPIGLTFHDGFLYVSSWSTNQVLRYHASDGSFDRVFVSDSGEGINRPVGLNFGPDGKLYVASLLSDRILRYNSDGSFDQQYASFATGSLPNTIVFIPGHQVTVTDVIDDVPALWTGVTDTVSSGHQMPGITGTINEGSLLQLTDPNLTLGLGDTDGTYSVSLNLAPFAADSTVNLSAVHYVTRDIVVGGNSNVQLYAGDVLFAHDGTETFTGSDLNAVSSSSNDVVVFRPDVAGNYASGVFIGLIDNISGGSITAMSLVERDTVIAGERVNAGDFIYARTTGDTSLIHRYQTINAGVGTTSGVDGVLFDGNDIGFAATEIQALHFVSDNTSIGGLALNSGQILVSLKDARTLNGTIDVEGHDAFTLTISATEGSGASVGSAAVVFDGSDIFLDTAAEQIDMLSLGAEVNGAPTATNLHQARNYTEGAASVALDDIVVTDNDAGETITATLTLNNPATGSLTAASGNGETYSSGIWSITGSVSQVNAALADVAFVPNTDNDVDTTITVDIQDLSGLGPSQGTITLSVTPANDPPSATNLTQTKNYTEDTGPVALDDITITDVDSNQTFTARLTLTNPLLGSITAASGNGESYTSGTGVWTVSGTKAQVEAALAAAAFSPVADNEADATITTHIEDQDGAGPADGMITLNVTPQNDPPSASNLNQVHAYNEGASAVDLDDIVITDVDSSQTFTVTLTLNDTFAGAITSNSGNGEVYSPSTGVWSVTGTKSVVEAALAAASFVPNLQNDVNTTITTHVEDQSGAGPVDGTIQLNVTPSNDTPTATNLTQSIDYNEGTTSVNINGIVITDPDTSPAQTFTFTLTLSDPLKGSLTAGSGNGETYDTLTGIWSITGNKAAVEAATAAVQFQTTADNDTDLSIETSFQDQDGAGPPNGMITLNVQPFNDPPTATELTQSHTYNEGQATVALNDIVVSDVDTDPTQQFTATLTLSNPAAGTISASSGNGETYLPGSGLWSITGTRAEVNAALAAATFVPTADNEFDTTIITHVEDQDGAGPSDGTITLNVTPSNDPPSATNLNQSLNYAEDATSVALNDIVITDPDIDPTQTFTVELTLNDPAFGTLSASSGNGETYSGISGVWAVTGNKAEVEAALAAVEFLPNSNNDQNTSISVHVEDQDGTGPADGVITLTVTPANDAPTATNLTQTHAYNEGDGNVPLDDIVVADPDNATPQSFTVRLTLNVPSAGALSTSGAGDTYNPATGVWQMTGTAAEVNAALAAVEFRPATDNDVNVTITTHVEDQDGAGPSDGTISLNVTAQNDAPTVVNGSQLKAYTEGATLVALDDIVVLDVDTSPTQTFTATLTLIDPSTGDLNDASGNGETYSSTTGIWTVTGTKAQVDAALAAVGFAPNVDNDRSTSVTTRVVDQDGAGPSSGTITLNAIPVADPPTATNTSQILNYNEGTGVVPIGDIVVSDPDTLPPQIITATLTLDQPSTGVLSAASGNGESYSPTTGIWAITGTATEVNAALAAVEFVPTPDNDLSASIEVRIVDQDGTGPAPGTIQLNVNPSNDAPNATNLTQTVTYVEDSGPVDLNDIVVSDIDSGETIHVTVTMTDATRGALSTASGNSETFNQSTGVWSVSGTVSQVNAALSDLSFIPVADNEFNLALQVHIEDAAGDGPADGTVVLAVTPVADSPRNLGTTSSGVVGFEDFINRIDLSNYDLYDPDADTSTITMILKTTQGGRLFGFGTGGVTVSGSGTSQILLTGDPADLNAFLQGPRIRYLGLPDVFGNNVDSISVYGFETTNIGANGPTVSLGQISVDLTNVGDDPTSLPESFVVETGETLTGAVLGNDDDVDGDSLSAVLVTSPTNGSLQLNSDGSFVYIANSGFVGSDQFTYAARDSTGATGNVATVTITVDLAPPPATVTPDAPTNENETDNNSDSDSIDTPVVDAPPDNSTRTDSAVTSRQSSRDVVATTEAVTPLQILQIELAETRASNVVVLEARGEQGSVAASLDALSRLANVSDVTTLRGDADIIADNASLWGALDTLNQELEGSEEVQLFVASSAAITSAFTVGYVVWLLRAGQLLTSVLAQMPAWSLIDPLPVLNDLDALSEDDDEDDSLQSMIARGSAVQGN